MPRSFKSQNDLISLNFSGFMRSLSSSAAVKSIRSYSQRLRRRISADVEMNSPTGGHYSIPSKQATPRRAPLSVSSEE